MWLVSARDLERGQDEVSVARRKTSPLAFMRKIMSGRIFAPFDF